MLTWSASISKLLETKKDCFKQARQLAVFHVSGKFHTCQNFYDALEEKGLIRLEMHWGSCDRGQMQNLVFVGSEQDILKRLEAIVPKVVKHVPTPTSVLAKMLAARLGKIGDRIANVNLDSAKSNTFADTNPGGNQARCAMIPALEFGDIKNGFARIPKKSYLFRDAVSDINEFLKRPDITDEVLKKGWELFAVKDVMAA